MADSPEDIFFEALELDPRQREEFIKAACEGDPGLLRAVEAYFVDSEAADTIFSARASSTFSSTGNLFLDQVGDQIGPYTLLELIGEGGFGVVWLAEQKQPLMRKAALKIVKAGMDTAEVLARFEAERQALARMEHPHIARVLDAGATPKGRPYFVMEWVRGIPITKFCDKNRLAMRHGYPCFWMSAQRWGTPTKRGSSIGISNHRMSSLPWKTAHRRQRLSISGLPKQSKEGLRTSRCLRGMNRFWARLPI